MSSLKGQLANVEGSVKSMKMAVVVGSVLTVACLAAVFGVTILANEVSKETKVSNGALVNRQGSNVATASMISADVREALLSKKMTVGDIIHLPIGTGSDYLAKKWNRLRLPPLCPKIENASCNAFHLL